MYYDFVVNLFQKKYKSTKIELLWGHLDVTFRTVYTEQYKRARILQVSPSTISEDLKSEIIAHLYQNHNLLEIQGTTSQRIALDVFSLAISSAE